MIYNYPFSHLSERRLNPTMGSVFRTDYKHLCQRLKRIQEGQDWSLHGTIPQGYLHSFFQYPAMMVPQIQSLLIAEILDFSPEIQTALDPFVGSGTTMVASMQNGLCFWGQDINPLAVLICRAKANLFDPKVLEQLYVRLLEKIDGDNHDEVEIAFPGLNKWFQSEVAIDLSKIRRAIQTEESLEVRRFFWVALAETIRVSSNSRTSTFKLHIRPKEEIKERVVHVRQTFAEIAHRNLKGIAEFRDSLAEHSLLHDEQYAKSIMIQLGDTRKLNSGEAKQQYDFLITSPPYGDNKSTVPYGQHAYLPLQWVDLTDIDPQLDSSWLRSTHEIDSRSLGGSLVNALDETRTLKEKSKTFREIMGRLRKAPPDRAKRVAAFMKDIDSCLDPILDALRPGAFMVWTVGNRRVGGETIRTDQVLSELLISRGVRHVARLERTIWSKRMANRNSITRTMRRETILVMRKGI